MSWGFTLWGTYFNALDTIIFVLMMIGAVGGCMVGFIESFGKTAGYVVGTTSGLMFTTLLSGLFMESFGISLFFASLASFLVLFMAGFLVVMMLSKIIRSFVSLWAGLTAIDMLLGFLWGMFVALFFVSLFCYALGMQQLVNVKELFAGSQFYTRIISPHIPGALSAVKEVVI